MSFGICSHRHGGIGLARRGIATGDDAETNPTRAGADVGCANPVILRAGNVVRAACREI